ncbi:MAG: ATP-binding protein, partial [Bacteroidota bacterium]
MHSRLVDFLNHGLFAFVGRSDEIERIASFWRSGLDADRLRIALLIGEAGVGKSRLVEESIPRIAESGGAVAHIKLYPESTSSIIPLITRALRAPILHRQLHLGDLDNTLFSSISALRRLARLRPAMLVIEDVHLLSGPALGELALLLEALSDEAISILCVARPMELAIRPIAERYLTMEIRLQGLTEQDVETLWMELFQIPILPPLLHPLFKATRGNPLALRSALRGAIQSGALLLEPTGTGWRSQVGDEAFIRFLRRNVELLSEGMAAHLEDQEKSAAVRLAWLGGIFSREAAELMIDRMEPAIASLMFKGVIAPLLAQPSPLTERQSAYPAITFTHSILHDHLAGHRPVEGKRLIEVISSGIPLYCILPFQLLRELDRETGAGADQAFRAITQTLEVARELDRSPDWKLGMEVWHGAEHLCRLHATLWDRPMAERLEAMLLANHLTLLRRSEGEEEYNRLVERLVEMTLEPVPEHLLEYRLIAHTYLQSPSREAALETYRSNWEASQEFVHRHPDLRYTRGYLTYLEANARAMLFAGDHAVLTAIEHQLTDLIA